MQTVYDNTRGSMNAHGVRRIPWASARVARGSKLRPKAVTIHTQAGEKKNNSIFVFVCYGNHSSGPSAEQCSRHLVRRACTFAATNSSMCNDHNFWFLIMIVSNSVHFRLLFRCSRGFDWPPEKIELRQPSLSRARVRSIGIFVGIVIHHLRHWNALRITCYCSQTSLPDRLINLGGRMNSLPLSDCNSPHRIE